jgi:hypothetical protein
VRRSSLYAGKAEVDRIVVLLPSVRVSEIWLRVLEALSKTFVEAK